MCLMILRFVFFFNWFGLGQMDKASIIKDAIDYIQELHDEERRIQGEIMDLESGKSKKNGMGSSDFEQELPVLLRSKKKKIEQLYDSGGSRTSSIEVLEVSHQPIWVFINYISKYNWPSSNISYIYLR